MNATEFDQIVKELQAGNEKAIDGIFIEHYTYVLDWLQKKYQCDIADAKDVYMDGFLKFRRAILKGSVKHGNIRGYLITIVKNIWLQKLEKNKRSVSLDTLETEQADYYLGSKSGLYDEDFDPLTKAETANNLSQQKSNQLDAFQAAWTKLGEKCRRLLKGFYIDRIGLKQLQSVLGYGSYDSIKSMRRKCFNQLKKKSVDLLG